MHRLPIIAPILDGFKRRFSVLDLGCGTALLASEIACEYDCVVIGIEKNYQVTGNEPDNLIILKHEFTSDELRKFSECEQFDVVLALNFLHWFDGLDTLVSVLQMGAHIVIQIPELDDDKACGQDRLLPLHEAMERIEAYVIGTTSQFPEHRARPLFYVHHPRGYLTRAGMGGNLGSNDIEITRTNENVIIRYSSRPARPTREWIEGLNLWTFCGFGGVVPQSSKVVQMVKEFPLPETHHGDIVPWNFILTGNGLRLIDGGEGWEFDDGENLTKSVKLVEEALCSH